MDYALVTVHKTFESVRVFWPRMPYLFHKFIARYLPPHSVRLPAGVVLGAGEGGIVFAPATLESALRSSLRLRRAVEKAASYARERLGARVVAVDPDLPAPGPRWLSQRRGLVVRCAGLVSALENIFKADGRKRAYKHEVALIGMTSVETVAAFLCLAEYSAGINLAGGRQVAVEKLAGDLWLQTGITPRIHKDPAAAIRRSKIIFMAQAESEAIGLPWQPGSVVIDLHGKVDSGSVPVRSDIVCLEAPVFDLPVKLPSIPDMGPLTCAALLEAAITVAQRSPGFSTTRPSVRDLRRLQVFLKRSRAEVSSFWHKGNVVSLSALTLSLA